MPGGCLAHITYQPESSSRVSAIGSIERHGLVALVLLRQLSITTSMSLRTLSGTRDFDIFTFIPCLL